VDGSVVSYDVVRFTPHVTSQKVLGTLPEDGNVMPKYGGDKIHN
jgi:hypothetical protein